MTAGAVGADQARTGLDALLGDRRVWRASSGPLRPAVPTGHAVLDRALRGGWPRAALTELHGEPGGPELALLAPLLARVTGAGAGVALVAPPHVPYAPALAAAGVVLERLVMVRAAHAADAFWALEQVLRSGACAVAVGWFGVLRVPALRRLHLAAGRGEACGFACVHRPVTDAPVPLRVALRAAPGGVSLTVRKGAPVAGPVHVPLRQPLAPSPGV